MKMKSLLLGGALFTGLLMFNACDNNETRVNPLSDDVDTDIVEQEAALEDIEESVFDEIDAYLSQENGMAGESQLKSAVEEEPEQGCPTVLVDLPDEADYPKVVTFDFGTENCEDRFGRLKRGKVVVTVTGPHWEEGSERSVAFEDFYVNDNSISGSKAYKNEGKNEDDQWYFSTITDVTCVTTEGITWSRTADKIRTIVAGDDTRTPWDDAFLITGTASGSSSEGYVVSREITTPVYRDRACRFPLSGTIEVVRTKDEVTTTAWFDYGDGETCDNVATVTDEDGEVEEVSLGARFKKQ